MGSLEISDKAREEIFMHPQPIPSCLIQNTYLDGSEKNSVSMLKEEIEGRVREGVC